MPVPEDLEPLELPHTSAWASIGVVCGPEIHAGHQSRILHAELHGGVRGGVHGGGRGEPIVVKLTDSRLIDDSFHRRVEVAASLADTNASVVGPVPIGADIVRALGQWVVVAYPAVVGRAPDLALASDVEQIASTLANLHESMAHVGFVDLPPVAALRDGSASADPDGFSEPQLLHGDYSDANTLLAGDRVRVFDFDDCGYGPVEFEVGNALYMVLFDSWMSDDMARYERFRRWFVNGYRSASGRVVPDAALDHAIGLRVDALGRWIDDPEQAPIGIRTATSAWRESLRAFVEWSSTR